MNNLKIIKEANEDPSVIRFLKDKARKNPAILDEMEQPDLDTFKPDFPLSKMVIPKL